MSIGGPHEVLPPHGYRKARARLRLAGVRTSKAGCYG